MGIKKACHMTSVHFADDSRILHREVVSLANNGWDATVVGVYSKETVYKGVKIKAVPQIKNRIFRMTWQVLKVLIKAWRTNADIYHFHDIELIPAGLVLKKLKRAKVIYDVHEDHNLMIHKTYIPFRLRKFAARVVNFIENFCAGRLDAVVTPTEPITKRFSVIAPKAVTLYNFPTQEFMEMADRHLISPEFSDIDVVHIGTLRQSRLEFFLQVALQVQKKLGPKRWTFIGMPKSLMPFAEMRVGELALEGIEIIHRKAWLELPETICRGKIGVNFHKLGEAHTEVAIPVKIFEYLACGLPTVSTSLKLVSQLLNDIPAVSLVSDNLSDYTESVIKLLTDPELSQKSEFAYQSARLKYSWEVEEKKLLELYEDILRN